MVDLKLFEGHTPGPWGVHDNRDCNGQFWIGPGKFFTIAEVRNGAGDEEYGGPEAEMANAHLIAAGPDLLAEIARKRDLIAQIHATMQALHPTAGGDMSNSDYARLWNATLELLDNEAAARTALASA